MKLRALFAAAAPDVPMAIGDDAALIEALPGQQGVWTTDLLLEGVHFRRDWQEPRQLGRKSLAVNLSDIAAMGARPRYALLSIACPHDTPVEFIMEFCRGFAALADESEVTVIGGDTTASTDGLVVSVTVGGHVPAGRAILRSGAAAGDAILVTGHIGDAAAGLQLLQAGHAGDYPGLVAAFLEPRARLEAAAAAAKAGALAMTDLSDGLASDLRHICEESGTGAMVEPELLPISDQLKAAADRFGWDREAMMLTGGEDYELLFTLPGDLALQLKPLIAKAASIPVTIIGEIMPAEYGIRLVGRDGAGRPMPPRGYEHFSTDA